MNRALAVAAIVLMMVAGLNFPAFPACPPPEQTPAAQEQTRILTEHQAKSADLKKRRSEALRPLTEDFIRLQSQRLTAKELPEQMALDAQLKTLSEKIKRIEEDFDRQSADLDAERDQTLSAPPLDREGSCR